MAKIKRTPDQIIQEITEVLIHSSGEFIELVANNVLTNKVEYTGAHENYFIVDAEEEEEE